MTVPVDAICDDDYPDSGFSSKSMGRDMVDILFMSGWVITAAAGTGTGLTTVDPEIHSRDMKTQQLNSWPVFT